MIKIDIKTTHKDDETKTSGSVEVRGSNKDVSVEIFIILKEFEKECPEALDKALKLLVTDEFN